MSALLLYGAYGYTGRLIVERAAARSVPLILAGRDENKLRPLGERHGCEVRAFGLSAATESLGGVTTVLNAAGPFSKTAAPMVDACLAAGANYVDITGEIDVFTALHARGNEALAKGIVLLPGAGFDVVPSDCLAAHVHRRLPDAEWLSLVIGGLEELSRGTAKTAVESIGKGTVVRRGGEFVTLDKPPRGTVDLGNGLTPTIGMSWGDVATAYYSTGIPDIDVFFEASEQLERATGLSAPTRWFMGTALGQWLAQKAIDRMPPGPDETTRETAPASCSRTLAPRAASRRARNSKHRRATS